MGTGGGPTSAGSASSGLLWKKPSLAGWTRHCIPRPFCRQVFRRRHTLRSLLRRAVASQRGKSIKEWFALPGTMGGCVLQCRVATSTCAPGVEVTTASWPAPQSVRDSHCLQLLSELFGQSLTFASCTDSASQYC